MIFRQKITVAGLAADPAFWRSYLTQTTRRVISLNSTFIILLTMDNIHHKSINFKSNLR